MKIIKIILPIIVLLLISGCSNKCVKSHKEESICTRYQYIRVGGRLTTRIPHHYNCEIEVCDEYETEGE